MGLVAPEMLTGAPPPGLDLVGDEENPVGVEHFFHCPKEPVWWGNETTNTLDGLNDHDRRLTGTGHAATGPRGRLRTPR